VQSDDLLDTFTAQLRDGGDLLVIDPDIARLSRAAVPAARAAEPQAVLIPWLGHGVFHPVTGARGMNISVIIPTLNEEGCLGETLRSLRVQRPHEILVVDGGSSDDTCRVAAEADRVLHVQRGRARQMNAGAAGATGEALLFLHADCSLEPGALSALTRLLSRRRVAAGCFTMTVRAPGSLYRSIDWCATARVRLTGLIYGDQGLFVRREMFEKVRGFPEVRLMEDVSISRRLRREGRMVVSKRRIFVSPRRWQQQGLVRQTLRNWVLTALAAGGVHPDRLAAFYPVVR
jgi:rSAM/selenodomain-associated transferase 2